MTTDERIDAIAMSLELMVHENRERDLQWEKRFGQLTSVVEQIVGSVDKLSHIAELHQNRVDSHDDRLDTLEGS